MGSRKIASLYLQVNATPIAAPAAKYPRIGRLARQIRTTATRTHVVDAVRG